VGAGVLAASGRGTGAVLFRSLLAEVLVAVAQLDNAIVSTIRAAAEYVWRIRRVLSAVMLCPAVTLIPIEA
jgi:hypothetical protein